MGVSLASSNMRDAASAHRQHQAGHETHMEALDAEFGDDDPSSPDPIGQAVLRESTLARTHGNLADYYLREAHRLDSSTSALVPPNVTYAQMQEYNRLQGPDSLGVAE